MCNPVAMDLERVSACTYAVREEPLDYTFRLIADSGYRKVDLWGGPPNYSNDPAECDIPALQGKAESYGLRIANLGTYAGRRFHELGHAAEMEEMRRAVDNAASLGSRSIRVCPGEGEDPAIIPDLIPFFEASAEYAAERGVYLGMENHAGSIAARPTDIMRLIKAVDSPNFGILYEPANLMACRVDYKEAHAAFAGHITHVHVKDSRWREGAYERTDIGEGDVDVTWVVRTLEADGYTGDYALEFEIERTVPVETGFPAWLEYFRSIE